MWGSRFRVFQEHLIFAISVMRIPEHSATSPSERCIGLQLRTLGLILPFSCAAILPSEVVAKSIKALNYEEHEGHKGREKLLFVLFALFVVPFFWAFCRLAHSKVRG